MAQINQVVGLQQVNETLKSLSAQFGWMGAMQGVQLVGRTVATEGNAVLVADGQAKAAFTLGADADRVTVEFLDPSGAVVGSVNAGARKAGLQTAEWSLGSVDPARVSTIRVSAAGAGGQAVEATPLALQRVQSVGVVDGAARLRTERGTLTQDQILAYL
jgi:flagellar basal-body rod modification protein FlgD